MKKFITCLNCGLRTSLNVKGFCKRCYNYRFKLEAKREKWRKRDEELLSLHKSRQLEAGGVYIENFFYKP